MANDDPHVAQSQEGKPPSISVILPVYNGEEFLDEAIKSVLCQTFMDFELLALDDGSTDRSLSILRGFAEADARVKIKSRENRGLVSTLNELISLSRGRYLARMDADDVCLPLRFERQVVFLDENPDILAVGSSVIQVNGAGLKIGRVDCPSTHNEIDDLLLKGHCPIFHPAVMVRAEAMKSVGGYRVEFPYAQDLDLWLRMSESGKLANLQECLLLYRLHSKSISEYAGQGQREAAQRATADAWRRRNIVGQFHTEGIWRPGYDVKSRHHFALQYGWTAWSEGYRETWRSYAWEALRLAPFSLSTWKLLAFGFFTRPKYRKV